MPETSNGLPLLIGHEYTWSRLGGAAPTPEPTEPEPPDTGFYDQVYFIRAGTSGPVKIGYANNARNRRRALQTAHHERLILLGSIPGDMSDERAWHNRWVHYHIRGEWFRAEPDLMAAIKEALTPSPPLSSQGA